MKTIDRFMGESFSHWIDIADVMHGHNIKDAKELNDRLGTRRIRDRSLRVVDSSNHKRVLGTLKLHHSTDISKGHGLSLAVPNTVLRAYRPEDCVTFNEEVGIVRFGIERETDDGGWTYTPYLSTSSPLQLLMRVGEFLLPGETQRQAEDRRWRSR